jgi:hypothetical protein
MSLCPNLYRRPCFFGNEDFAEWRAFFSRAFLLADFGSLLAESNRWNCSTRSVGTLSMLAVSVIEGNGVVIVAFSNRASRLILEQQAVRFASLILALERYEA